MSQLVGQPLNMFRLKPTTIFYDIVHSRTNSSLCCQLGNEEKIISKEENEI